MKSICVTDNNNLLIKGPLIIIPEIYNDERGFFYESWNKNNFDKLTNRRINFVQDNHSYSLKGTLRGLHFQLPSMDQSKLVRCIKGEIFDVIVDLRLSSNTFGKWTGVKLSSTNKQLLWVPSGFAHGFLTISESAEVLYKTDNFWSKEHERTLYWNDPQLLIKWPIDKVGINNVIQSKKDLAGKKLSELKFNKDLFQ